MGEDKESKFELELLCKNIQSVDRTTRQKALKEFLKIISDAPCKDEILSKYLDETYLHLIRCYADKFESCRSLAISIVSVFLSKFTSPNQYFLDYIVPIIWRRIGQTEIVEESEELQLQLLEQIEEIVDKFKSNDGDSLMGVYNDLIDILLRNLSNRFANAQRKCCDVIKKLANATKSFYLKAECLVDPLIELLKHRQSATRILAIEAIGLVCLYITNKNDKIVKSIVSMSPLLMDSVAHVRRACGLVACQWLLSLPDRYSFFERIIPMVLCCLKDDMVEIRTEINQQFMLCGKKYYEENEAELQKLTLIENAYPCENYCETVAKERPTLGCRALVERSLRMVNIIVIEMSDWKESVRVHSLRLLWELVLFAEKAFTCKFVEVFPALAKSCQDDDPSVRKEAERVAFLMGQLLNYDDWLLHTMKTLERFPSSLGTLRCFNSLFAGADSQMKMKSVGPISKLMTSTEISHNLNSSYQNVVLDLTEQLVEIYLNKTNDQSTVANLEEQSLFEILVKTIALTNAHEDRVVEERGIKMFEKFCVSSHRRILLQDWYTANVINAIEDLDCEHTELSERIIMLYGCIKLCGFQILYFDSMKKAIKLVMKNSTTNAQIKILAAVSIAMLNWNHDIPMDVSMDLLSKFIDEIIEPCLIWKAGRNFEAIRAMATQALCSIGDACPVQASTLFPKLAKHFLTLMEDDLAITRAYAIRCLLRAGVFSCEDYRQLAFNLLNKLDDPSANVRSLAIECLAELKVDHGDPMFSETSLFNVIESVLSKLILYLDDPYVKIRPILLDSIAKIAKKHPSLFQAEVDKLPNTFLYAGEIEQIKALCLE